MSAIKSIIQLLSSQKSVTAVSHFTDNEWEDVAITAIAVGLAPLLHWQLERLQIALPPMTLAKLAVTRQAHAKRNQAIAHQLAEILSACEAQRVEVIVLKGALLASLAYPEPALRPMNDIDLLFHPDDTSPVSHLLEALGYHGKHKEASRGPGITKHLSTYRRNGQSGPTPNPYLSAAADRTVEPHISLEESWFGLRVDITPGVWQRAVPLQLNGQAARRLSSVDMLVHLAVHATFHIIMGASAFVQLYDIGRMIETWSDELDWGLVVGLTNNAEAQPFVYAAFYWAKKIYGTPIPDAPLAALKRTCPSRLQSYIHCQDAASLFQRTQQPPLTSLGQRLKRGLADRHEAARWVDSPADKWRIWQTVLAFHKTDTASLLVGKKLKADR